MASHCRRSLSPVFANKSTFLLAPVPGLRNCGNAIFLGDVYISISQTHPLGSQEQSVCAGNVHRKRGSRDRNARGYGPSNSLPKTFTFVLPEAKISALLVAFQPRDL